MKKILPILIIIIILAAAGGGGYWYFSNNPDAWQQTITDFGIATTASDAKLSASGFIEADEVTISAEVPGRITELTVGQGDAVSAGQMVAQLDTRLLDAKTGQVEAQIALALTQLAQAETGAPKEQIAVAQAAVTVAQADADAAKQAIADAELLRDNPQQLNAQIDAAYSEIALIDLQIKQAELIQNAVMLREGLARQMWEKTQNGFDWKVYVPGVGVQKGHSEFGDGEKYNASAQWNLATTEVWQVTANLNKAKDARQSAVSKLNTLLALKDKPLEANLQVSQAKAVHQTKLATIDVANAVVMQAKAGLPESRVAILRANLAQAQAQMDTLAVQREKFTLTTPSEGVVVNRPAQVGEVALPGVTVLTIADLNTVTLTVYVPESQYGTLTLGQSVSVSVDTFPNETFAGTVDFISDQAEFTPKNVQTQEERVNLVYAIKITLPNPDRKLKPGMPADATFN